MDPHEGYPKPWTLFSVDNRELIVFFRFDAKYSSSQVPPYAKLASLPNAARREVECNTSSARPPSVIRLITIFVVKKIVFHIYFYQLQKSRLRGNHAVPWSTIRIIGDVSLSTVKVQHSVS